MTDYHACAPVSTAFEVNGAHFSGLLRGVGLRLLHEVLLVIALNSFTLALCEDVAGSCSYIHLNILN